MTTLAADKVRRYGASEPPEFQEFPVITNDIIYEGAAVAIVKATGFARPATGDTSVEFFAGFAVRKADNTGGADGAIKVQVRQKGIVHDLPVTGATIDDYGKTVYADDDDTFTLTLGAGTADVPIGKLEKFVSAGIADVRYQGAAFTG